MIDFLKQLLSGPTDERQPPGPDDLAVASTALMVQLSRIDRDQDERELDTIVRYAVSTLGVPEPDARRILDEALAQADDATSLYEFTGLINDRFDQDAKQVLLENIWRVAFADGRIDKYEEHLIRRMADLLHLNHREYMQARLRADAAR
ncbi:tellurite resistance TerB family protein [Marinobacter sp. C2H3]|uniref:tellurite resistance TerB family protein n=1 Tax=Marinobacter sp. C2H3 TaxID=3119003 RepID=UPI00300E7C46